uniref:Uncharacterized protein n=1 Tax=Rhizophora mucronata TaxID=61149 RepID=A0A2P2P665_RHIMU
MGVHGMMFFLKCICFFPKYEAGVYFLKSVLLPNSH